MAGRILYYSKTGHTARVARSLAEAIGVPLAQITTRRYRMGGLGYARAGFDSLRQARPRISVAGDLSGADWLILGTPIWTSYLSTPMRSFLAQRDPGIPIIGVFTTGGGQGEDTNSNAQIAELGPEGAPPPRLALLQDEIETDAGRARIAAFAEAMAAAASALAIPPAD